MARAHNPGGNAGKGRKPGVPNKATAEVRAVARQYPVEAIETLAEIMRHGTAEAARVAAANALLDRGHGKPMQQIEAESTVTVRDEGAEATQEIIEFFERVTARIAEDAANGEPAVH